jgi:GNAT superfamily N-acetyltransferase
MTAISYWLIQQGEEMAISNDKFKLRAMQPSDSASVASLVTEFDGDMTTRFLLDAYTAITSGTENHTLGVVVECAGHDGFVGMGTVRFNEVQYNGEILPHAFLDGLKVHKDFRGQGLGYKIADWRIQHAREAYGDKCVIATGMLQENLASYAVARKWCREFIEPAFDVLIVPTRRQPPKPLTGITAHEIESHEYEEFAARQNIFYENYNLYPLRDAGSIANALDISAEGRKPYRFFVAVDSQRNLLAGAQTWARGILKSDTLNNPPMPLRILNNVLHVLPSDFIIRDIAVNGLWYEPDQLPVARFLWEMIRWECKEQGTTIAGSFDPRDPVRQVVLLKPWNQPRPKITVAIHGQTLINREKLLFAAGRV